MKRVVFKISEAGANDSEAMEQRPLEKRASLKSRMSRVNNIMMK